VIGGAPTGSGKTICFALPILQTLSLDPYGIYALVLTPTRYRCPTKTSLTSSRELAFQIADQFNALGAPIGVRVEVVVGGKGNSSPIEYQIPKTHI
jgi:ATP-dependent RNA helicase DDX49/DBP8